MLFRLVLDFTSLWIPKFVLNPRHDSVALCVQELLPAFLLLLLRKFHGFREERGEMKTLITQSSQTISINDTFDGRRNYLPIDTSVPDIREFWK